MELRRSFFPEDNDHASCCINHANIEYLKYIVVLLSGCKLHICFRRLSTSGTSLVTAAPLNLEGVIKAEKSS